MENTIHKVQPGETLSSIAENYGISHWKRIAELNNISDSSKLPVGKVLKIPNSNDDDRGQSSTEEEEQAQLYPVSAWCLPFHKKTP